MASILAAGCSPLRSSPSDAQHLVELTLHEVQTNLDDLRHDVNCFKTELQIIDGRIQSHENALASLKQQDFEKLQFKLDHLAKQIQIFEKNHSAYEKGQTGTSQELKQLSAYANETNTALVQFKQRILEMEHEILEQNRRFEELSKIKGNLETIARSIHASESDVKLYRVKQGDTLKKIATEHQTTVEKIKKINHLEQDTIVIGQSLKIPESG